MNGTGSRVGQADKTLAQPFKHTDALKAAQTDSSRIDQLMAEALMAEAAKPEVRERGAGFRFLTEGLDTTRPMGTAMLMIVAAFGQLERDTMIERTRAGLAAAAANNRHGGRPGLAAKPIIDIVVTVHDITAEEDYLDVLLAAGYELRVREPGHRTARTPGREPRAR